MPSTRSSAFHFATVLSTWSWLAVGGSSSWNDAIPTSRVRSPLLRT